MKRFILGLVIFVVAILIIRFFVTESPVAVENNLSATRETRKERAGVLPKDAGKQELITFHVLDKCNNEPIAGCNVYADGNVLTTADEKGRFNISSDRGAVSLRVSADGYFPAIISLPTDKTEILLNPLTQLKVTLTTENSRQSPGNTWVEVRIEEDKEFVEEWKWRKEWDGTSPVLFENIPQEKLITVAVLGESGTFFLSRHARLSECTGDNEITFKLAGSSSSIAGIIRHHDGKGAGMVRVCLATISTDEDGSGPHDNRFREAVTMDFGDYAGAFGFSRLPAGEYELTARLPGGGRTIKLWSGRVGMGEQRHIGEIILPASGTVKGRVVDQQSHGLAGLHIACYGDSGIGCRAVTNSDGSFQLLLLEEDLPATLTVFDSSFSKRLYKDVVEQTGDEYLIRIDKPAGAVRFVGNSRTTPVVIHENEGEINYLRMNHTGEGYVLHSASEYSGNEYMMLGDNIIYLDEATKSSPITPDHFLRGKGSQTIEGTVDVEGEGMATVIFKSRGKRHETRCDNNGKFAITLSSGIYSWYAYAGDLKLSSVKDIVVSGNRDVGPLHTSISVPLDVEIYVFNGGKPVERYPVRFAALKHDIEKTFLTDAEGKVSFSASPGEYVVQLISTVIAGRLIGGSLSIEESPGRMMFDLSSHMSIEVDAGWLKGRNIIAIDPESGLVVGPLTPDTDNIVRLDGIASDNLLIMAIRQGEETLFGRWNGVFDQGRITLRVSGTGDYVPRIKLREIDGIKQFISGTTYTPDGLEGGEWIFKGLLTNTRLAVELPDGRKKEIILSEKNIQSIRF